MVIIAAAAAAAVMAGAIRGNSCDSEDDNQTF